ncbi:hypothetical protein D9M69_715070 [compost metagenome]
MDFLFLAIDFLQIGQAHGANLAHRLQRAMPATSLAVTPGHRSRPVGRLHGLWQHRFNAGHQLFGALQQAFEMFVHGTQIKSGSRR